MDSEEIRKRQQRRKLERQRREERQKKLRQRIIIGLIAAVVVMAVCGLIILLTSNTSSPDPTKSESTNTPETTQPQEPETTITLAFGGDLNVTDKVVASGVSASGYDYTEVFMDIMPALAGADATVLNFEGNLCGVPYGTESASAPPELLDALSAAGVDMLQMANSYSIHNGLIGLQDTLDNIRSAGLEPLGAYGSNKEFADSRGFTLRSINGIKVAFVAFTKGMTDSLGLPEGSENCVNLLYTDYTSTYQQVDTEGIREVLQSVAAAQPDVTIALLHWGSEHNNQISASQKKIISLMQEEGVDAIIGTHPHYVQQVEYDRQSGTLVAYSLGDFLGDGTKSGTEYSMILELEITKNNQTGQTKISEYDYTPIYTVRSSQDGAATTRILRIEEAIASYEANSISKVSEEIYNSMKSALGKIRAKAEPGT